MGQKFGFPGKFLALPPEKIRNEWTWRHLPVANVDLRKRRQLRAARAVLGVSEQVPMAVLSASGERRA